MKKTSLNKRILSLVMVFCLSFTFTCIATAEGADESEPELRDTVLDYDSSYITNYTSIDLYLSSGNWSADFYAAVVGNVGATYEVYITTPGGTTYSSMFVVGGGGTMKHLKTFAYASAGTYTFEFYRVSGDAIQALAVAQICD